MNSATSITFSQVEEYYKILGVEAGASEREIATAYRFRALKLHPDKNRDDPTAQERFLALTRAYQILSDPEARRAAEAVVRLRREREARLASLDAKRRRLQEDLLERERLARGQVDEEAEAEARLRAEIERLRRAAQQAEGRKDDQRIEEELDRSIKISVREEYSVGGLQQSLLELLRPYQANPSILVDGRAALVCFEDIDTALTVMEGAAASRFPSAYAFSWAKGSRPVKKTISPAKPVKGQSGSAVLPEYTMSEGYEEQVLRKLRAAQQRRNKEGV
jgi:DnaJ family protein C protein 17